MEIDIIIKFGIDNFHTTDMYIYSASNAMPKNNRRN